MHFLSVMRHAEGDTLLLASDGNKAPNVTNTMNYTSRQTTGGLSVLERQTVWPGADRDIVKRF